MEVAENAARQKWRLTQDAFDGLLSSLGPDRDIAADQYLRIRRDLARLFQWRGCPTPDEYADEAINRCARKIAEGEEIRDVRTYSIGVARMLAREMGRERAHKVVCLHEAPEPHIAPPEAESEPEIREECLRHCLAQLSPENRDLILNYYRDDKGEKIKIRKELMQRFGISASTLRMRALRIRERLQLSAEQYLQERQESDRGKYQETESAWNGFQVDCATAGGC
jgi:RNA polymerase sigma factor (sigma-70 family)